jgi:hypothetical protein
VLVKIYELVGGVPYPTDLRRYSQTIKIQVVAIGDWSKYIQASRPSIPS